MASLVLPLAMAMAREPAWITSPVSNGVLLALSRKPAMYLSVVALTCPWLMPLLVAPTKCSMETCCCSSSMPLLTVAPTPATAAAPPAAMGIATALPMDLSLPPSDLSTEDALSLSLTTGEATVLPIDRSRLPTALILEVAISLTATAVAIFLRSGAYCLDNCLAFLLAAVASSRALYFLSHVFWRLFLVLSTSRRKADCSFRTARNVAVALSLIEITPDNTCIRRHPLSPKIAAAPPARSPSTPQEMPLTMCQGTKYSPARYRAVNNSGGDTPRRHGQSVFLVVNHTDRVAGDAA